MTDGDRLPFAVNDHISRKFRRNLPTLCHPAQLDSVLTVRHNHSLVGSALETDHLENDVIPHVEETHGRAEGLPLRIVQCSCHFDSELKDEKMMSAANDDDSYRF